MNDIDWVEIVIGAICGSICFWLGYFTKWLTLEMEKEYLRRKNE